MSDPQLKTLSHEKFRQASFSLLLQPQEFIGKSERERTELKSGLLLERFKILFRSGVQVQDSRNPQLRVLAVSPADPDEAMFHITMM